MVAQIDRISEEVRRDSFDKTVQDIDEDSIQYEPWDAQAAAQLDERQAFFVSKRISTTPTVSCKYQRINSKNTNVPDARHEYFTGT